MKNIRKQYEGYHEKGFDVVGVSVDEDRQALESFVKENKVPWTVVTDHALEKEADDKSMATRYGVSGIPECILVGKDGKVLALSVRGKVLADYLEKLLGATGEDQGGYRGTQGRKGAEGRKNREVKIDTWERYGNKCRLSLRESIATFAERKATIRHLLFCRSLGAAREEPPPRAGDTPGPSPSISPKCESDRN